MARPSIIPSVRLRLEEYLEQSEAEYLAQPDSVRKPTLADHLGKRLLRQADPKVNVMDHSHRLLGAVDNVWRELLGDGDLSFASRDYFEYPLAL